MNDDEKVKSTLHAEIPYLEFMPGIGSYVLYETPDEKTKLSLSVASIHSTLDVGLHLEYEEKMSPVNTIDTSKLLEVLLIFQEGISRLRQAIKNDQLPQLQTDLPVRWINTTQTAFLNRFVKGLDMSSLNRELKTITDPEEKKKKMLQILEQIQDNVTTQLALVKSVQLRRTTRPKQGDV